MACLLPNEYAIIQIVVRPKRRQNKSKTTKFKETNIRINCTDLKVVSQSYYDQERLLSRYIG